MRSKLTNNNFAKGQGSRLDKRKKIKFKVAITNQLDNRYCFKNLNSSDIKTFHKFLDQTVNKNLSITDVDSLFKRTKGPKEEIIINNQTFELIHLGKDQKPFRVFGYYNPDGYFVITRIDPKHKTHC